MTAITYGGETPSVGGDDDTWGTELNTALTEIKADLDMLNTASANSILGRNEGTSGEVERLTGTEVTAMLNAVGGDSGSGGTKGLVPAPAPGVAAKGHVLKASGAFGYVAAAHGGFVGSTGVAVGTANNLTCANNGPGDLTFSFGTALPSTNYAVFLTCNDAATPYCGTAHTKAVGSFKASVFSVANTPVQGDPGEIYAYVVMLV